MKEFFKKLKALLVSKTPKFGKKFEIGIAAILFLVIVIIFLNGITVDSKTSEHGLSEEDVKLDSSNYVENLERRLERIVGNIKGAGETNVFIMTETSTKYIYATDDDGKKTESGGDKTETSSSSIVFSKDGSSTEAIVALEIYPEITGVLVVSEGAKDEKLRIIILNAVSVALNLESTKIDVLAGEPT